MRLRSSCESVHLLELVFFLLVILSLINVCFEINQPPFIKQQGKNSWFRIPPTNLSSGVPQGGHLSPILL